MKPVCPNCHSIIHRKRPCFKIEEVKNELKKFKLKKVESLMKGEVIYVERMSNYYNKYLKISKGVYRHYGVDIGDNEVIHFSGENETKAKIIKTSKNEFAKGGRIEKSYMGEAQYSEDEIVSRAYSKLGDTFGGYDLINNNCEHFANWCVRGKKTSVQVAIKNDDQDIVEKAIDKVFEPILWKADMVDRVIEKIKGFFE